MSRESPNPKGGPPARTGRGLSLETRPDESAGRPGGLTPAPREQPERTWILEAEQAEKINIIRYVNILLKRRWLIIGGCFACILLAAVIALKTPPTFTATAKFLPSPRSEMTARMGTIIGSSGKLESFEENLTSEYYVALLQSNIFLERVAGRKLFVRELGREADLVEYYTEVENFEAGGNGAENPASDSREILQRVIEKKIRENLSISAARRTAGVTVPIIVTVSYSASQPDLAADIVNAFIDETVIYNQDIRESKTRSNREFIEKQIAETTDFLARAENELAEFTARNKRIATPDLEVELDRLKRNVRIQEEVYISLKKQLELAKIEEQERKTAVEIIERALPPLERSAPRRAQMVMIAGITGFFLFCGLAFAIEWIGNASKDRGDKDLREFFGHIDDIRKDVTVVSRLIGKNKRPR